MEIGPISANSPLKGRANGKEIMSTENPADTQLVDYDDAEDAVINTAPIQEEEEADSRKFILLAPGLFCIEDTTWA